jgi:diadenosine tetraphosphate (Ap4A) HIT family hydrolase
MAIIYESLHFIVEAVDKPLIDRDDGGHIIIEPKIKIVDRQQLSPAQAIELMRLTMAVGEAMKIGLAHNGVDIGRINYQDNGNWSVLKPEGAFLHVHLYGRAINSRSQPYGQACHFPHPMDQPEFYASLKPLRADDIIMVRRVLLEVLCEPKYADQSWRLP